MTSIKVQEGDRALQRDLAKRTKEDLRRRNARRREVEGGDIAIGNLTLLLKMAINSGFTHWT